MSSITRQRVGKYTYLYESKSYRDKFGRPRNKKTRVGKIDPVSGEDFYDQCYVDKMTATGTPIQNPGTRLSGTERSEIALSIFNSIRSYGAHYLLLSVAKRIGLIDILSATFADCWQEIFTLACYLIQSDKPLMYCDDWLSETETLPVGTMSSQRISELLTAFDANHRNAFYESWGRHIAEQECIALDITSVSSYSELMTECEWGYNRDNENLPQINICMLMGETSRLPIYQTVYSGSLTDVTTLKNALNELTALVPERRLRVVMDKGFYSAKNVNAMLTQDNGCDFIISIPFKENFAKRQVADARKTIDHVDNIIFTGKDPIRGVHKVRAWGKDSKRVETHTLFNPAKEMKEKNELYGYVTELKRLAQENPKNPKFKSKFENYLIIRRSNKDSRGYTVNLREDVMEEELRTKGWLVLISNFCIDTQEAHDMYRAKDVVEKGFWGLKNALGLGRLRVHSDERMQNKLFVGFFALIMMSHIHTVMSEKKLYKTLTMDKLFITLSKIKTASINGTKLIRPVTKEQREILAAFDLEMSVG